MNAIDTSLLYAAFNAQDEFHKEGRRVLSEERPILVPPGILQETLDLLGRRHGARVAADALAWLAKQPRILIEAGRGAASHGAALEACLRSPRKYARLSFADVWCIAHAHEHGVPLLTKDAAQRAAHAAWGAS